MLKEWGVEVTAGSIVLFRRIGAIYLGLALMFFLGRAATPSDFRSAVCLVTGGGERAARVSGAVRVPGSSRSAGRLSRGRRRGGARGGIPLVVVGWAMTTHGTWGGGGGGGGRTYRGT